MKKWQENRNYRRIKDEQGETVARIITVDGVDVEVTEEVFLAYSQPERRERYITEEVEPGMVLSWEKLLEDGVPLDSLGIEPEESAEDTLLELEESETGADMKRLLADALLKLRDADRQLLQALYFNGVSARAYARQLGVSQRAVIKRRDRILRDMKIFFEKFSD
jgi:RNA polymerase sigma factor (sigma-70 family)